MKIFFAVCDSPIFMGLITLLVFGVVKYILLLPFKILSKLEKKEDNPC